MNNREHKIIHDEARQLANETSALSKEMYAKLEKHEAREIPVPATLYHVTQRSNLKQILQEGINPSSLIFEDSQVVSLSDDIPFAISVAEQTQNISSKDLVILEIDTAFLTPSRIENYLRKEDPTEPNPMKATAIHEVHYQSTIPPEAIKVIK